LGGVNLAVIEWGEVIAAGIGDERAAWRWKPDPFTFGTTASRKEKTAAREARQAKQAKERLDRFQAAVRANRQLATALRDQGMNEEADAFAYRAQVVQRSAFAQQGKRGRAILSLFLDVLAGHGYRPARSLYTYLGVLFGFAFRFFLAGNGWLTFGLPASQYQNLPWYEALILSVSSFHGRGFFQPLQTLCDPVAIIASVEAVFGLFIEVAFIATFTQRYFGMHALTEDAQQAPAFKRGGMAFLLCRFLATGREYCLVRSLSIRPHGLVGLPRRSRTRRAGPARQALP